jgi:D-alanine-D-alanine ligase
MKTIAVIFGSRSAEHDISILTALSSIIKPLELTKQYKVEAIYINKDGDWFWDDRLKDIKIYQTGAINEFMRKASKTHLLFDNGLTLVKSSQFAGRKKYQKIDLVFPATHGTFGEDGRLMGLLDMAGVPYVGCDMASSAVAMDKVVSKLLAEAYGVPITKMKFFKTLDYTKSSASIQESINKDLKYPLFVKPAHLGSSIGITKVVDKKDLNNAIEVAGHYDDKILVEEAVENLVEVTLPIMGHGDDIRPALLEQPLSKSDDFFDFDTKYMRQGKGGKKMGAKAGGGKQGAQGYSQIPADLPKDLYDLAMQIGLKVFDCLGCSGIARVDMLVDTKAKKVYFNEVNPLPGSLYNHNWRKSGVSPVQLVQDLVHFAEIRAKEQSRLTTTFNTNFLQQF